MRPILWDVDEKSTPPRMTICFVDHPKRFITVRIKAPVGDLQSAKIAAVRELQAFTPDQLQLLAESSQPMAVAPDPDAVAATIQPVEQEDRYRGLLHCPACCRALGKGTSPAIGYLAACPGCQRKLIIRFAPGSVTVILWTE